MGKYYYSKNEDRLKRNLRLLSILLLTIGVSIITYVLFPIISWQIYFQPAFASQNITSSIPRANIVISSLISQAIDGIDYTKAENWFPKFNPNSNQKTQNDVPFYKISIPKINIKEAVVSTTDTDLTKHLVNFQGTSIPAQNGNAVVFGHSTLPQLFDSKNYKTIFANAYKLKNGDDIYVFVKDVKYSYKIFKTIVIDPSDTSALQQDYDNSYLTLVTCTPPGTIWKRLVVKARLQKI